MNTEKKTAVTFAGNDKERFEHGIAMLKAYYDALEGRLSAVVGLFVVALGWMITSDKARQAFQNEPRLVALAVSTLTLLLVLYGFNVAWWVRRWAGIKRDVDALNYIEPRFYARYELPRYGWKGYFVPVALLYVFMLACLVLIMSGDFV